MGVGISHLPFLPLAPGFYAALLAAMASRIFSPPAFTLICVGLASAFLARLIFRTPLSQRALTCPTSTELGRVNERVKLPYCRSTRRKFSSFSSFSILRSPWTVRVLLSMPPPALRGYTTHGKDGSYGLCGPAWWRTHGEAPNGSIVS